MEDKLAIKMVNKTGPIPHKYTHCAYCELEFTSNIFSTKERFRTRDHFIPLSRGGSSRPSNLFVVCQHCNLIKGNFLPFEFIYALSQAIKHKEFRFKSNGKTYGIEQMEIVYKNVKAIYNSEDFTKSKNANTHIITTKPKKESLVNGYLRRQAQKESSFSVNTNTSQASTFKGETATEFLKKRQRHIDLMEKRRLEPEPNFHEPE